MENDRVHRHFEEEAGEYDDIIVKLIPHYRQMVEVLTAILPFRADQAFHAVDLGCGTGTVARSVRDAFPRAKLTCVDVAANMLELAGNRLGPDVELLQADFESLRFPRQYDAVVSSLALHHLATDEDKQEFYQRIYKALSQGGIFVNADVVCSENAALQAKYMAVWRGFMVAATSAEEVEQKWLPNYYAEDRPTALTRHLEMLRAAGFSSVDVVYKYYNYAVYCAVK